MNFKFNHDKTLQTIEYLIILNGGKIEYHKLSILLYLIDRNSLLKINEPIIGGHYIFTGEYPKIQEADIVILYNLLFTNYNLLQSNVILSEDLNVSITSNI